MPLQAAAVNFGLWVRNLGIQEYMRHAPETDAIFLHSYWFEVRLGAQRY